jgi:hypothetical protein
MLLLNSLDDVGLVEAGAKAAADPARAMKE